MRIPLPACFAVVLFAGLVLPRAVPAQSQTPPPQQQPQQNPDTSTDANAKSPDAKSTPAPKKVYTNDDLGSAPKGGLSVVGNGRADGKAGKTTAANNEPKNEQYWRGQAQKIRAQIAEVDRQIAQLKAANQPNGGESSGSNAPAPAPLSAYSNSAHARAGSQMQKLQDRKAQLEAQMDQLEEQARKANVPPGWLR